MPMPVFLKIIITIVYVYAYKYPTNSFLLRFGVANVRMQDLDPTNIISLFISPKQCKQ